MIRKKKGNELAVTLQDNLFDIPSEHAQNVYGQFDAYVKKIERTIGVKKDIEQLERQLRPKPEPAPKTKTTKPRTRKPAAKPAARRGRPPKAAKAAG